MDADHTAKLEAARSLQSTLENTPFHIVDYRDQFDSQQSSSENEVGQLFHGGAALTDPAIVAFHVASQMVRSSRVLCRKTYTRLP